MAQRFYRVIHDVRIADGWFPGLPVTDTGNQVDAKIFTQGIVCDYPGKLLLPLDQQGRQLDFTLAAFDMPVVSAKCADILTSHVAGDAIQRFPVTIEGADGEYEILNVTRQVACLDEQLSSVSIIPSHMRTSTTGRYRWVIDLTLDPSRIGTDPIFRVKDWTIALIVSEDVRDALSDIVGISYLPVT